MKYIIMCGGQYDKFTMPKQFIRVKGEALIFRTIRLLKENGIKDINISSTDQRFKLCGVPVLVHENNFRSKVDGTCEGYWLDAFYPTDEPVTYIFGDVYFSDYAIKQIIQKVDGNVLCGNGYAKNEYHLNWGEPFAYIVNDQKTFREGIDAVKKMFDEGKVKRHPIVWELYRYLNGFDINTQWINDDTYICIDDGTNDIDAPWEVSLFG